MNNFIFNSPTKIYFVKNYEKQVGEIIKEYGFKNIALVYGKGSIKKINLYNDVISSLKENNINYIEISGVEANPKLSFVKNAKKQLKNQSIDLILAVGGGSVIDTCKLLSHCLHYPNDPFDFNMKNVKTDIIIPVGVILTISAAGSELSDSCVITNDEVTPFIKKGFNSPTNRPLFAICNPELTYSVNKYQTGCGIVDIMMHTLERYINPDDECMLSEEIAIALLKTVMHYGKIAIDDPTNYEARANLMLASSISHNGLTGLGKRQMMRVHGLEHILSGHYDCVAHGAGLSILWPAWCYYVLDNQKANELLTNLAKELFNKDDARSGIDALKDYFNEIGMPTSLSSLKLNKPLDIELMANEFSNNKTKSFADFKTLNHEAFIEICNLAK